MKRIPQQLSFWMRSSVDWLILNARECCFKSSSWQWLRFGRRWCDDAVALPLPSLFLTTTTFVQCLWQVPKKRLYGFCRNLDKGQFCIICVCVLQGSTTSCVNVKTLFGWLCLNFREILCKPTQNTRLTYAR